jgi:hypothetical protein
MALVEGLEEVIGVLLTAIGVRTGETGSSRCFCSESAGVGTSDCVHASMRRVREWDATL